MTYEKHKESLEQLSRVAAASADRFTPAEKLALNAAIELMRAAEPKDAAAERAHCDAVEDEMFYMPKSNYSVLVERERAQARAEVEAKYARLVEAVTHYRTERLGNSRNKSLGEVLAALDELEGK